LTQPSYPPPPPFPKPPRFRPSIVTKLAFLHLVISVALVISGAWGLYLGQTWNIAMGIICIIAAVVSIVYFLGLYVGKNWVLSLGWRRYLANRQDVMTYFGCPFPVYASAYPPPIVPPPAVSPSIPPSPPPASVPSPSPAPPPTPVAPPTPCTPADTPPTTPACPTCEQPLFFVHQYNRWYCHNCKKYV